MSADKVPVIYGVSSELEKRGCYKLFDVDEYNEFWITPWGFSFAVPICDVGMPISMWMEILKEIEQTKPK